MSVDTIESDIIQISIKMNPSLKQFVESEKIESQELKQKLRFYMENLVGDLALPFDTSINIELAQKDEETLILPFTVYINNQWVKFRLDKKFKNGIEGNEFATLLAEGIIENRELLLTESLSGKIYDFWFEIHGEFLKKLTKPQFHEALLFFIRQGMSINRVIEEFSKYKESNVNILPFFYENAFTMDSINIEILLSNEMYRKYRKTKLESNSIEESGEQEKNILDEKISMMVEGLFYELGLFLPTPELVLDYRLADSECRFKLNDLRFPSMPNLADNEYLVNDTVDRLSILDIDARVALNPANLSECSIITGSDTAKFCESTELTTWDPPSYVILALSALIREHAYMFLSSETTTTLLNKLKSVFPALIEATQSYFTTTEITVILRKLLEEEISIRNLGTLLEELIINRKIKQFYENDPATFISESIKHLRISQHRYLSNKYGETRIVIVSILLDTKMEEILEKDEKLLDKTHLNVLKQLCKSIRDPSQIGQKAVILTKMNLRPKVRSVIHLTMPKIAVLAFEELSHDMDVQPIDKIKFQSN